MAAVAAVAQHYVKFPGFETVPSGLSAVTTPLGGGGVVVLLLLSGFMELSVWAQDPSKEVGDFGDPVGLGMYDTEMRNRELNNGRMAMFAALGIISAELLTGKDGMQQLGLGALGRSSAPQGGALFAGVSTAAHPAGAVALRASGYVQPFDPAKQVGAMAPLGFFDPLGFSKVGDKDGFRNLRAAELKHGRVAMMAAVAAVAQHYVKFPGFETVPSGLSAVTTPLGGGGVVVLLLLSGFMELSVWAQDPSKEVGDFGDPVGLGMYDTEMRNRELNNGRMAMFAALGIISAELLTGKDGMQQLGF